MWKEQLAANTASHAAAHCPDCGAFIGGDGVCHNPLCGGLLEPPGVPRPENGWQWRRLDWQKPGMLDGDDLREALGIPWKSTVTVSWRRGDEAMLQFFDPQRPFGFLDGEQMEFVGPDDIGRLRKLVEQPGETGFVVIDNQEWDRRHPLLINPLIDAPGVSLARVERGENGLSDKTLIAKEAETFRVPDEWDDWHYSEDRQEEKSTYFMELYGDRLDECLDFTYESWSRHRNELFAYNDGPMTPRTFAANRLHLWGFAGQGHHGEARRLARLCGVTLVGEETCPLRSPKDGQGNSEYLFDYTVDDQEITAFAIDLNKHHVYAFPDDERNHKHGLDNMYRIIGREEARRNWHNWAIVHLGGKEDGTQRHESLYVRFALSNLEAEEARTGAQTIASLALRAGHDPSAAIYYDAGCEYVETTVRKAALGHEAQPAPPAYQVTDVGQQVLDKVLAPYNQWLGQGAVNGTPQAHRAENQMVRAARSLKEAIEKVGINGKVVADLDHFCAPRRLWSENFGGMMAEFSTLKQQTHMALRRHVGTAEAFGQGFDWLFGG